MMLEISAEPAGLSPWPRRVLGIGLVWAALLILLMGAQEGASLEDQTLALSISLSGGYTLLLYGTRRWWLPRLAGRPLRNAMLLGSFNAAVIEALFLVVEKIMGAEGVAAHPNLLIDWLICMPWYIGMVIIFVRVQRWRRFSPAVVLLLGGIYEAGADGVVGGGFEGTIFSPGFYVLLPLVLVWLFVPVYSSLVLPSAWLIATQPPPVPDRVEQHPPTVGGRAPRLKRGWTAYRRWLVPKPAGPAWRDALRPLVWLVPFAVYLLVLFVILSAVSEIV